MVTLERPRPAPFPGTGAPDVLAVVDGADRWIRAASRRVGEDQLEWVDEPDTVEGPGARSLKSLANGGAGIIVFLMELAAATGRTEPASDALRGANHLAATWRDYAVDYPEASKMRNRHFSLMYGIGGMAFVLAEVARRLDSSDHRAAAIAATDFIVDNAESDSTGVIWTGAPAMAGDGGIMTYLAWAGTELGHSRALETAIAVGERTLKLAEEDRRGGLRWLGMDPTVVGYPPDTYIPNFTAGTAGVAFSLARLADSTGDRRFLEAALGGAEHIRAIATVDDGAALVCHHEPGGEGIYYVGQCMGPAGTARLFYELYRQTGDQEQLDWVHRLAEGVLRTGAPELESPGYWNTVSQCCGTAGLLDFFLSLWVATGREEYLDTARSASEIVRRKAFNGDGAGHRWYYAPQVSRPSFIVGRTNYLKGAAGPASSLLRLDLAERGTFAAIRFPDNPFPAATTESSAGTA